MVELKESNKDDVKSLRKSVKDINDCLSRLMKSNIYVDIDSRSVEVFEQGMGDTAVRLQRLTIQSIYKKELI